MNRMNTLDKLDKLILRSLQVDGRATYDQIAEQVSLSPSAVLRRVKRLEEAGVIDVIVVPALQVDPRGHRIGYGAGYYDSALPRFAPPARAIAVAFSFQLIAEVPVTEGDVPVSLVVMDEAVYGPPRLMTAGSGGRSAPRGVP